MKFYLTLLISTLLILSSGQAKANRRQLLYTQLSHENLEQMMGDPDHVDRIGAEVFTHMDTNQDKGLNDAELEQFTLWSSSHFSDFVNKKKENVRKGSDKVEESVESKCVNEYSQFVKDIWQKQVDFKTNMSLEEFLEKIRQFVKILLKYKRLIEEEP